jgi:hypothetical protein
MRALLYFTCFYQSLQALRISYFQGIHFGDFCYWAGLLFKCICPQYFPNASGVFMIGCRESAGIRALAIKVNNRASFVTSLPWQELTRLTQEQIK